MSKMSNLSLSQETALAGPGQFSPAPSWLVSTPLLLETMAGFRLFMKAL